MESTLEENLEPKRRLGIADKILISVFAGVAPIATKYLARDSGTPIEELYSIYLSTGACLVFLAAVMCYLSKETDRMKMFMLAVSAPALISNMSAESNGYLPITDSNLRASLPITVTTAAIASESVSDDMPVISIGFTENVKRYFGKASRDTTDARKYWVIVLSTKDEEFAKRTAIKINQIQPELNAFVGLRRPNNEFYPVIIGDRSARDDADKLMTAGRELSEFIPELDGSPYLDAFENRR